MPAADTQHGRKAPPRKKPLQIGKVVAKTQRTWEQPKRAPKSSSGVAPNFPRYVPPSPGALPNRRPPRATTIAVRQEKAYGSQAGAVRRAAATQRQPGLGVGKSVRPPKGGRQVLTRKLIEAAAMQRTATVQEKGYKSLGQSVAKQAEQARVKNEANRKVPVQMVGEGGKKVTKLIDAALVSKDPKVQKAGGLKTAGLGQKIADLPFTAAAHVPKDLAELAVTTPTSLAHLGVQGAKLGVSVGTGNYAKAGKQAVQIGKEQAAPYKEAWKDPTKFVGEHPVTSYLMFAPTVKVPLRAGAKGLRVTEGIRAERAVAKGRVPKPKKHTLVREPASLPGTAVKETRTASVQPFGLNLARKVRGQRVGGKVTEPELKRRVDEHADQAQHREQRRVTQAVKATRRATRGQPKHERKQAIQEAEEHAREQARLESDQVFARDVGANVRPSVSHHEVAAAKETREAAKTTKTEAKGNVKSTRKELEKAEADARAMRGRGTATVKRAELDAEHVSARKELRAAEQEVTRAEAEHHKTHREAAVSQAKVSSSPRLRELESQRKGVEKAEPAWGVELARKRVSDADRRVNQIERQVQQAEERASHLEGVTAGRAKGGAMTMRAGRAAADQAERLGGLYDALHEAHAETKAAREHLTQVERHRRGRVRSAAKVIDEGIRDERRRILGVAPEQHQSLLNAIERREAAHGRRGAAQARVRDVQQRQAIERSRTKGVPPEAADRLLNAIHAHDRALAEHESAKGTHETAKRTHIETEQAHRNADLVDAGGEGRLFDNPQDAKRVTYRLNQQAHTIPTGAPGQLHMREPGVEGKPVTMSFGQGEKLLQFKVRKVGEDQWAVVPKIAGQRMYGGGGKGAELSHASVGTGKATGARFLRTTRGALTKATLPFSLKWLGGQGAEAGIRAAFSGAGPVDYARFNRVVKRMNEIEPGAGDAFMDRILGGQFDPRGAIGEQALGRRTLAEEYEGTSAPIHGTAKAATLVGHAPVIKQTRGVVRGLTRLSMQGLNGLIENTAKKAMAGQAIRQGPLMEMRATLPRLHGMTEKAIDDAARGLMQTHNQVEASRGVNEMYGKYRDWSPEMKSLLQHWTPFLPWYLNTARFLFHTLPTRHPMKAALLANMVEADRDWRMSKGLSFYSKPGGKEHAPEFLLGSYPNPKDPERFFRVGHYTPWGIGADPAEAVAGLAVPQFTSPLNNLRGLDWKNQPLTKAGGKGEKRQPFNLGEKVARAGLTAVEGQVPLVSQADRLSGLGARYVDKREESRSFLERLKAESPTTSTKAPKKKAKKAKPAGFGSSGFGGGFGSGGFGSGSGF